MDYLQIGKDAVKYVRTTKGAEPTNLLGNTATEDEKKALEELAKTADKAFFRLSDLVSSHVLAQDRPLYDQYTKMNDPNPMYIRAFALATFETGIGNCEALACTAFDWLARSRGSPPYPIELWEIKREVGAEDAHVLVVIGRTKSTHQEPEEWDPDCVVVDPWTKDAYPASELRGRMQDENGMLFAYAGPKPVMQALFRLEAADKWPWDDEAPPPHPQPVEGHQADSGPGEGDQAA
jgi:hypothetical protein